MNKDDDKIKDRVLLEKSLIAPKIKNISPCERYTETDLRDYLDLVMDPEKRKFFERHYPGCLACSTGLNNLIKETKSSDEKEAFSEDGFSDTKVLIDDKFDNPDVTGNGQPYLMAASSELGVSEEQESESAVPVGISYGVAVDTHMKKGFIIQCVATVSKESYSEGTISFNGEYASDLSGMKQSDTPDTSSFKFLAHQLNELFKNNIHLIPFELNKRNITIEASAKDNKETIFSDTKSLALASVIAVLNAVKNRPEDETIVFSSRIRQDGALLPRIGDVPLKVETAFNNGAKKIVMPEYNSYEFPEEYFKIESLTPLFFSHLGHVLQYFGLLPPHENLYITRRYKDSAIFESEKAGVQDLQDYKKEISKTPIDGISDQLKHIVMKTLEQLANSYEEGRILGTCFIIGDPDTIHEELPSAGLTLKEKPYIGDSFEMIRSLATLVDGKTMGFVLNKQGMIESIRKIDLDVKVTLASDLFLGKIEKRLASISKITESFVFTPVREGKRIQMFHRGILKKQYDHGTWHDIDLSEFERIIKDIAQKKKYDLDAVNKVAKNAFAMSNLNLGALFVFIKEMDTIYRKYIDQLDKLGVELSPVKLIDISDDLLINYADEKGAVLIDAEGNLQASMAYLVPNGNEELDVEPGAGPRHISAQRFSYETDGMAVVVSEDGGITIYCAGKKLYRL